MRVCIIMPAYNSIKHIEKAIFETKKFMGKDLPTVSYQIVVCENSTNDGTKDVVKKMKDKHISYIHTSKKGRGWAVKYTIQKSPNYDSYIYFDVDLAGEIGALIRTIEKLQQGYDVIYANRYHRKSNTSRSFKRLIISKTYNFIVDTLFSQNIRDYQCGFKGFSRKAISCVLAVKDDRWFFDTEVLLSSKYRGLNITNVPINWVEQKDSSVNLMKDIWVFVWSTMAYRIKSLMF